MSHILSALLSAVFLVLGLLHVVWAFRGGPGAGGVIPEVDGRPVFAPSTASTLAVAAALFTAAALVAARAGLFQVAVPESLLVWGCYGLAAVMLGRAIGDFRLIGFFKRVRGTRFARLDTALYSPLCLALALGVWLVATGRAR